MNRAAFLCIVVAASALAADPVSVRIDERTFQVSSAPLAAATCYPAVDDQAVAAVRKRIAARREAVAADLAREDPAAWLQAREARGCFLMFSAAQQQTDGPATQAAWLAWQRRIDARLAADAEGRALADEEARLRTAGWTTTARTLPVVTLDNGLLRIAIAPTTGLRVLDITDLGSGRSLSGGDPAAQPFTDRVPWDAGHIELNVPFWEHGMRVDRPAGWRVVHGADGAVTVALHMRFTANQAARDATRYGAYGDRPASLWLTLRPGEARYHVRMRLDNLSPLRRSARLWAAILAQAEAYDADHVLFPAGVIVPHGAQLAHLFRAAGGTPTFRGVSHFALFPEHRFCGLTDRSHGVCSLIIPDPGQPGMKLYTPDAPGGFCEFWIGSVPTFETQGGFLPGFEPVEIGWTGWLAAGVGQPVFANADLALAADGSCTGPVERTITLSSSDGRERARGAIGPGRRLQLPRLAGALTVRDAGSGAVLAAVTLPLTYADTRDRLGEISGLGGSELLELEETANHKQAPSAAEAGTVADWLDAALAAGRPADPRLLASVARTCYRFGRRAQAVRLAAAAAAADPDQRPAAALLTAMDALEDGRPADLSGTGLDGDYLAALLAVRGGDRAAALACLDRLIAARPRVWLPRLLAAWLRQDRAAADRLADEHPASPEAQVVRHLLGADDAAAALAGLTGDDGETRLQAEQFRATCLTGAWTWIRRYAPDAAR
jgi:hypothetical protein